MCKNGENDLNRQHPSRGDGHELENMEEEEDEREGEDEGSSSDDGGEDDDSHSYDSSDFSGTSMEDEEDSSSVNDQSSVPIMLVVTGASRGLGRAIAKSFCTKCNVGTAILVSRSGDGLHEAGKVLKELSPKTQLVHHALDLKLLDDLDGLIDMMFLHMFGCQRFGQLVFVNCAGSLGHLGPATTSPSLADMRETVDLNVTSSLWLSVRFARFLKENPGHPPATLINISSLVAIQPFPTMGIYSAGKAARDMFHKVLALENPNLRVLNYAPGPLETDMTNEIRNCESLDPSLKPNFEGRMIDPGVSADKMVDIVLADEYESGAHVDFYD